MKIQMAKTVAMALLMCGGGGKSIKCKSNYDFR